MPSVVEICNMSLGNIGIGQTIASLDEKSNEARACKRFYEQARNEALRNFPWPFATRFVVLALVETNPNVEWAYSYQYPSDCEKVRRVIPTDVTVDDNYRDAFVIASGTSGRLIFSNQPDAQAEITYRVSNPALFDSSFITHLSWVLAFKIAPSLTGNNKGVMAAAAAMTVTTKAMAAAAAMNEGYVSADPYSEFIQARE